MNTHKVIIAGWFTVDPVDPSRVNNFEYWQSEEDLESFRAVANPPKQITPILSVEMQKHEISKSRQPF
jgi:hypothetical protein